MRLRGYDFKFGVMGLELRVERLRFRVEGVKFGGIGLWFRV